MLQVEFIYDSFVAFLASNLGIATIDFLCTWPLAVCKSGKNAKIVVKTHLKSMVVFTIYYRWPIRQQRREIF